MKNISHEHNGWTAHFVNPITSVKTYLGRMESEEDAIDLLSTAEISFYSGHKYLLPKGITIRKNDFFVLVISIPNYSKLKNVHLGSFKLLEEAKERKLLIISKLID